MGDQHVCSFCGVDQQGKQHVKLVFENWPVEETHTYKYRGQERSRTRTVTKEVITAIGLECLGDPARWSDYAIEGQEAADFFEHLRFAGKNPTFRGEVAVNGLVCHATSCAQRQPVDGPETCAHVRRTDYPGTSLDQLYCWVGHPGVVLVRGARVKAKIGLSYVWHVFSSSAKLIWPNTAPWHRNIVYGLTYGVPALFCLVWGLLMMVILSPYYLKRYWFARGVE